MLCALFFARVLCSHFTCSLSREKKEKNVLILSRVTFPHALSLLALTPVLILLFCDGHPFYQYPSFPPTLFVSYCAQSFLCVLSSYSLFSLCPLLFPFIVPYYPFLLILVCFSSLVPFPCLCHLLFQVLLLSLFSLQPPLFLLLSLFFTASSSFHFPSLLLSPLFLQPLLPSLFILPPSFLSFLVAPLLPSFPRPYPFVAP